MIIEGDKFRNKNQKTRINIIPKKRDDTQKGTNRVRQT